MDYLRLIGNFLKGINALAYFGLASVGKKKFLKHLNLIGHDALVERRVTIVVPGIGPAFLVLGPML